MDFLKFRGAKMLKITHYYDNYQFNFSFLSNHPFNNNPIIKKLITDGYFTSFQCPEDLSYLLSYFSFEQVHSALSCITNTAYNSFNHMNQLIEAIVLNEFENGISVYSTLQMETALNIFNHFSTDKKVCRQGLAKLIRNNNQLIHSGRGQYIHASKLLYICYQRKKATSDLLTAFENLMNLNSILDGQKAFDLLKHQCSLLNICNQYALYGFVECFKPMSIIYTQDKIGVISYRQKKHSPDY